MTGVEWLEDRGDSEPIQSLIVCPLKPKTIKTIGALWRRPVWQIALVNQVLLFPALIRALRSRGLTVHASCVWEFRSRDAIARLQPDAAFVNLRR